MDITDFSTGTEITIYIPILDKMIPAVCKVVGPRGDGIMVTQPKYKGVPLNEMHDFSFSIHDKDNNSRSRSWVICFITWKGSRV